PGIQISDTPNAKVVHRLCQSGTIGGEPGRSPQLWSPAKVRISLPMLCATLNDSGTEDISSSPSPQVAVIIARRANFWGSPASDAAFSQRIKMLAESTAFRPGLVGTIP